MPGPRSAAAGRALPDERRTLAGEVGDVRRADSRVGRQDEIEAGQTPRRRRAGSAVPKPRLEPSGASDALDRAARCRPVADGARARARRGNVAEDDPKPRQAEPDGAGDRGKDEERGEREDEPAPHRPQAEPEPAATCPRATADVERHDPGAGPRGDVQLGPARRRRRERDRRAELAQGVAEGLVGDRVRSRCRDSATDRPSVRGREPLAKPAERPRQARLHGAARQRRASRPPRPPTGRGSSAPR